MHNSRELSTIFVRLSTSYVSKTIIYYQSSFKQMPGDVDNLFVEIVSKFAITACYVENVDKLSTKNVDKFWNTACSVESGDKLSTFSVDN